MTQDRTFFESHRLHRAWMTGRSLGYDRLAHAMTNLSKVQIAPRARLRNRFFRSIFHARVSSRSHSPDLFFIRAGCFYTYTNGLAHKTARRFVARTDVYSSNSELNNQVFSQLALIISN